MKFRMLCWVLIAASTPTLFSQITSSTANRTVDLQIRLSFDDGTSFQSPNTGMNGAANAGKAQNTGGGGQHSRDAATNNQIRVELQDTSGAMLDERSPNGEGKVSFLVRNGSSFRVRITGPEVDEVLLENVQPAAGDRLLSVELHRRDAATAGKASDHSISAKRLQAPSKAKSAVEEGTRALVAKDYVKAQKEFEKAIEIYPDYDMAYNNLGVVFMQLGQVDAGRKAFAQAIALNGNFARAYINLAKIELNEKHFAEAGALLAKAISSDPLNSQAIFLAVQAALFSGDAEGAIALTKKLHSLPHMEYGVAHLLAARAYESRSLPQEAKAEYAIFLQESPQDPNVPLAQQRLGQLK